MVTELLRTQFFIIQLEERAFGKQIVRVIRTSASFPSLDSLREHHLSMIARLDRVGRRNRSLLIDLREAPGRRDPEFEQVMDELRPKMMAGYRRIGILTASALGLMQVRRHTRKDGVEALTGTNEAEIIAFLTEP